MALLMRHRTEALQEDNIALRGTKRKNDEPEYVQRASVARKIKNHCPTSAVPGGATACQQAAELDQIIRDLRITFHARKFCPESPGNVPKEHQLKFSFIQQLGQMRYHSYALFPRAGIESKPWELENKMRALRILEKAVESREDFQNEDGWRMKVETRVFERFEIEVACHNCRKRLWQSHLEADPAASNSRTSSLAERQKRRQPCQCEPLHKQYSIPNSGLSEIFSTRIGERSLLRGTSQQHRAVKKPDRVHGFRTTGALDIIMQQSHLARLQEDSEFEDTLMKRLSISCNPDSGGKASIYPFLVMEAKSLKGGSNFKDVEAQTALPIRNHLYIQLQLQEDEHNRMQVPGGPLSWFIAYIGETWRVYGCYVTRPHPEAPPYYNIILLWEGSVTGHDAALQLVLIVDYIVDWARDIYRPSIMRQLMSVVDKGSRSAYTIIEEPDILSIPGDINTWLGERPSGSIACALLPTTPPDKVFDAIEFTIKPSLTPLLESVGNHVDITVWDSAMYESRVRGIYVTENNIDALKHIELSFGCYSFPSRSSEDCWIILSHAKDISVIEQTWIGSEEIPELGTDLPHRVCITLFVECRVNKYGRLIRELTYLALPEVLARNNFKLSTLEWEDLCVSAEELAMKLREGWASTNGAYFERYFERKTGLLCATASEFDRISNRVSLDFCEDLSILAHTGQLRGFIKNVCDNTHSSLFKVYKPYFRYSKAIHKLIVGPYRPNDRNLACVEIHQDVDTGPLSIYFSREVSQGMDMECLLRNLVQMLAHDNDIYSRRYLSVDEETQIILWIVSDSQWNLYLTTKGTLNMPGMDEVHETVLRYRKIILEHTCDAKPRQTWWVAKDRDTEAALLIQNHCKTCKRKRSEQRGFKCPNSTRAPADRNQKV